MAATIEADASAASGARPGFDPTPAVPVGAAAPGTQTDQSGSPEIHFSPAPAGA
jgi:hypothetical protein